MTARLACLVFVLTFVTSARADPTPYPAAENEAAWPGRGPIRLFQWMPENRAKFWTQRQQDQRAVVFAGDSLTAGWCNLAEDWVGLKVANRGIGGDTSRGLLFRFKEDVVDLQPRAVVLCIGTNDLSAEADPALVEENIEAMIVLARADATTVPIVLCTVPPRDNPKFPTLPGAHSDLNRRITRTAERHALVAVLDLHRGLATADGKPVPEYFGEDHLHLAAAGYRRWAELLRPVFERLGIR